MVSVGSVVDVVEPVGAELVEVPDVTINHLVREYPFLQIAVTVRLSPTDAEMLNVSKTP